MVRQCLKSQGMCSMSSGMRTHEHAFFVSGVTRVAGLCPLDRVKRDFLVVSASKAMLVVTVSIGGSLHGHYNHWRGLGKAGVFDVRGGCHRADPETPDAQARRLFHLARATARRHRGGDGSLQRRTPVGAA